MCCTRLAASRWKYRTQKWCKKSPSAHHRTTLSGYIFATKARIDNREKFVEQQYLPQMSLQYGELRPTGGWDRFVSLGQPSKFHCYYFPKSVRLEYPQNVKICILISFHYCTRFNHLQSCSKLTLHLASRRPTRFITDSGSAAERYQQSPTATADVRATQRSST